MERFWSKVNKSDGCWEWVAGKDKHGYGRRNCKTCRRERYHANKRIS